ncbi:hypothetical protein [Streptomyces sp. NPDC054865]
MTTQPQNPYGHTPASGIGSPYGLAGNGSTAYATYPPGQFLPDRRIRASQPARRSSTSERDSAPASWTW